MSKAPAFQFYADDFLAGTMDMTALEVGVFMRLLCHQWNRGGLPKDMDRLQKMAGSKVSTMVLEKFSEGADGMLRNSRLEKERDKQNEYREKQRAKGLMSGLARRTTVEPRLNHGSGSVEPKVNQNLNPVEARLNSPSPISCLLSPSPKEENKEDTSKAPRFQPPTVEECREWFKSEGLAESEGDNFHAFYESNGWRVGKNKMQKWRGSAAGWKSRYLERAKSKQPHRPEANMVQETLKVREL